MNHAITNFDITGEVIYKYYQRLGIQEGFSREDVPLKKALIELYNSVYVTLDPDRESARIIRELDSGRKLRESNYKASECIFKPSLVEKDSDSLDSAIMSVLSKCEVNFRRGLCNNIVVYGPAVFRGLRDRLRLEIQKNLKGSIEVKVIHLR
ncbi:hypothetical protein LCGC14_2112200 [marine sediment metagenome]|uniref:Uncharacterized protein n=1 Tax=marine sediment metagenome TaxID=412755 RepID=A0A0F9H313_9ZZZZ